MMPSKSKKSTLGEGSKKAKIQVRGLCKSFGSKVVLSNLDLDVFENESIVVLGGSGSGKSVLIKCIVGLLKPDSGSVTIDGVDVLSLSSQGHEDFMRKFGFLFQGGALFDSLKIWENIAFFFTYNQGISQAKAQEIASENLSKVGLDDSVLDLYPSQLSGGMQKRVAFARAIAHHPEILFFDEPTTGLDPIMTNVVNELIVSARGVLKTTSITITHDINSTRKIATRVAMLYEGKIIWTGDARKIDNSDNKILEQFIKGDTKGPIVNF